MPIFHIQYSGQEKTPDGKAVPLPPETLLAQLGPRAQVAIGLAKPMANQWTLQGIPLPSPLSGNALFDTGASVTCVDDETARLLGLPVINMVSIASASHEASKHNVYPISFELLGPNIVFESIHAVGGPLKAQGLVALIGRDVLRHCTLHYNGVVGQFTLAL